MLKTIFTALLICTASTATAKEAWVSIPEPLAMPVAEEQGLAEINGISMYYASYGSADTTPILMIHGGLAHGDIWAGQVADLSVDYRVIVADTRGHGRSTNDGTAYSVALLAADYLALLDSLKVDQVHLIGWSDGANIGYEISKTAPSRLASHFAHGGNVTLSGINPAVEMNDVFDRYVDMMAVDYSEMSNTPDGFDALVTSISQMWYSNNADGLRLAKSITVPTLVVQSEHDEVILASHAVKIAGKIPEATVHTLHGVSHFAMLQDVQGYSAAIRDWLKKLDTSPS